MTMQKRLNYAQETKFREAADVVKGVAKRVIVVKSPDPRVFEEAIFIVREDYMKTAGVSRTQLLSEARQAADSYVGRLQPKKAPKKHMGLIMILSSLLGSGLAAALILLYFI